MSRKKLVPTSAIGQRIKIIRERLGLNQRQMAKEIGVSAGFLSDVESGKGRPSFEVALGLANIGQDVVWALTGNASSTPSDHSTDPELQTLQEALAAWWSHADEDERAYLRVVLRRNVPELKLK